MDTTSNRTVHICVAITRLSSFSSRHFALSAFNLKSTLMQYSHKHCINFVLLVTRTFLGHSFENVLKLISTVGFSSLYCRNTVWIQHSKTLFGWNHRLRGHHSCVRHLSCNVASVVEFNHRFKCILWNGFLLFLSALSHNLVLSIAQDIPAQSKVFLE